MKPHVADAATLHAAEWQMLFSTGILVPLSALCIGLPVVVFFFHRRAVTQMNTPALALARRWSFVALAASVTGMLVAIAVVAQTFLLWPSLRADFMDVLRFPALATVGGLAVEVLIIAAYLHGFDRISPGRHPYVCLPVIACGVVSVWGVVAANSWLSSANYVAANGKDLTSSYESISVFTSVMWTDAVHLVLGGIVLAGLLVGGTHAVGLLDEEHLLRNSIALRTGLGVAAVPAVVQVMVGLLSLFEDLPTSDSFVAGIFLWLMLVGGVLLAVLGTVFWWGEWTGRSPAGSRTGLRLVRWSPAVAFAALESGWVSSILRRGKWLVYEVSTRADAVTDVGGVWAGFWATVAGLVAFAWSVRFLRRLRAWPLND